MAQVRKFSGKLGWHVIDTATGKPVASKPAATTPPVAGETANPAAGSEPKPAATTPPPLTKTVNAPPKGAAKL